jgi:class 3 adenylate cyclase/predicted ATPase
MPDLLPALGTCGACGAGNPVGARFCNACGAGLGGDVQATESAPPSPSPETGERRQLTVLFCDLVGSTELSERLDPEDYSTLIRRYHDRAAELIARFGGSVGQYMGDGVLAYFGWPAAYGNDPDRAVRAGLVLVEAVRAIVAADGRPLAARVGIHTGPVVVSEVGRNGKAETVALGETLNVAARVQTLAEPGTVLVTAVTHRLVSGLFHVEEVGARTLKGVSEPVLLYRVVAPSGVRNRLAAAAARGLTTFVGRESERRLLHGRWERVQEGDGQMVLISGEAGIGKSRLVEQLKEDLRGVPHTWIECSASPYHENSAFYPLTDMLQQGLAWRSESPGEERIETIERAVMQVGLSPAEVVPLVAPLLDLAVPDRYPPLPLSPEQQRPRLIATVVDWISATARLQPTVFVVEDLHWVDPSTLEVLGLLVEQAATVPLLIVLTARPTFRPPWPPRAHDAHVILHQLTRQEVAEMIACLGAPLVPSTQMFDTLVARTGGVPLFVEELVRMLVEARSATDIPETLQDSLMARLDRLGPAKQVAQVASVIGRRFSYELLRGIAQRSDAELQRTLGALVDAELVYAEGLIPDTTYLFKHALIQEAAYGSLLKRRRTELHRAVADCLATEFPAVAEAQPEVVAEHYTAATLAPEAMRWWQTAGERANKRAAHAEAIKHYGTALELLAGLPGDVMRDRAELGLRVPLGLSLASSRGYAAPEVEENYRRAHELCQRLGETAELFPVVRGLCTFYIVRDNHLVASQLADQCLRIGQETRTIEYLIEGYNALGYATFYLGELRRSRALLEQGVALYESHRGSPLPSLTPQDPGVACLSLLASVLWLLGHPDQAVQRLEDALALARGLESPFSLAYCHTYAATAYELWRDYARSAEHSRAAIQISTEHGFDVLRYAGTLHVGIAKGALGEADDGIAVLTEALAAWRASGTEFMRPYFLAGLAEAHRAAGRMDEAMASVVEALEHAERGPDRFYDAELHRLHGELTLARAPGAQDVAEADFGRAIAIARAQEAKALELRTAVSLGRLLRAQNRGCEARELLQGVYGCFTEGFQTRDMREAAALLAELS